MRLLIVDDEHYIVNYLSSLIEEHASSELDIYKCYSGVDVLTLIKSVKIDLMLLDIHMPGLSGIDVASRTAEILPGCRIIFLTAYDNFDHIYETNKLKYSRYLLKTEPDETILNEVFSALKEIREETEKLHLLSSAQQKALLLSHLLQQNILKGILAGEDIDNLNNELQLAGKDFALNLQKPVYLMYTQIHYKTLAERNANRTLSTLQYLQLMGNLLLKKFSFSMLDTGRGYLLWLFQPTVPFSSEFDFLKIMANDFSDYCTDNLHRRTTVVLYPGLSPWSQICKHFQELQQFAESSLTKAPLIYSSVNVLEDDALKELRQKLSACTDRTIIEHQFQELSFYLYQGSGEEYFILLKQLCTECIKIKSMHDISAIKIYTSTALMLLNYIDLYQLQEKIVSKIALYPLYYIHDFSSWHDAFSYLEKLSKHIFDIQRSKKSDKNALIVNKIKSYIEEHLADSLTLTTISNIVNYNETYISRLFKQINGSSLSEYISQERIKKAKYLLSSTSESMQNIAAATGFDTSQYFSIVFKKTTGISPSEYRRTHLYTETKNASIMESSYNRP